MGLMDDPTTGTRLVLTPHPVTLEGQRHIAAQMEPGEKLGAFLARTVPDWEHDAWEVRINGAIVPHQVMEHVRPKDGTLVEVRGIVRKQALYIVAMVALAYFTVGIGTAAAGTTAGAALGFTGTALSIANVAVFVAGSVLINKVLGPKVGRAGGDREQGEVHTLAGARNRARPYEPVGLLFGTVKIAPDLLSAPYAWYEADQQYLGLILTPGVNVASVEALYNGDAPLTSFNGVQVWHSGFPGMPEQQIPLYSNADTLAGGDLEPNGPFIERTTSADTQTIQIDIEGLLYDVDKHGTIHGNSVPVQIEYRPTGSGGWTSLASPTISNGSTRVIRRTFSYAVTPGQYDVRVRLGQPTWNDGSGKDEVRLTWTTLRSIQPDTATYNGIPRIGIKIQATGQLSGTPDELRCVAHSRPIPVWDGSEWSTAESSNPGAQILAYARGITSGGQRVAGMGLPDDMIDIAALQAFMLHCAAEGYRYDYWLTEARSHDEVLNSIARAGFGQISWAGGRLSVVWAADSQPLSGVVNMATIKRGAFQVDYTLANAADGIEATWFDAEEWTTRTLRVPAPGVEVMLNPAQLQLEGITSEDHAAQMARWHLAQSLYQFKDISYSTDIEHLSYRRLSMLALQHDLTQWGYGGRLRAAVNASGVVTVRLDEPVPPPSSGNAYVGLRIPGERIYRVFQVQSFSEPTDELTLAGTWPGDAALPGNVASNPAHDTIWIYDFKQTPGLRVRVVSIEPESDLKGARVAVVPEGPEFWNYVRTGEYIPANPGSLLQTRPVASELHITEQQTTQGDTVFTELSATFEVDGPYSRAVVFMAAADGVLEEVAQTTTRSATWRIPRAGVYTIVVRPFSPDGNAGVAASISYTTQGADAPPVLVDLFDVEQRSGGVRLYTWGWLEDTIQSADFAGVEIRYTAGEVTSPSWEAMTPLGESGYFTAPFEAVMPPAGTWTFACRSRNTAGTLSTGARVITRTLSGNLGEVIGGIGDSIDELTQEQVAAQMALDQEIADRLAGDLAAVATAAADATAKANAARDAALAQVDALAAEIAEIVGAPDWDPLVTYAAGFLVVYDGALYRARVSTTGDQPDTSPTQWEKIGDYASVGEVAAAALQMATQNASDLGAESTRLDAIYARMPAAAGGLALQATVAANEAASVSRDNALGTRVETVEARMPGGSGALATSAQVASVESASVSRDTALGERTSVVEARMPSGSGTLATAASVTAAESASVSRDNALASNISLVSAQIGQSSDNLVLRSRFEDGELGRWGGATVVDAPAHPFLSKAISVTGTAAEGTGDGSQPIDCSPGDVFDYSADINTASLTATSAQLRLYFFNAAGAFLVSVAAASRAGGLAGFASVSGTVTAPANAVRARPGILISGGNGTAALVTNIIVRRVTAADAANAQAIQQAQAQVTAQGGQISAMASNLSSVTATVNGQSATITELAEVTAGVAGTYPVVINPGFEYDYGWQGNSTLGSNAPLQAEVSYAGTSPHSGSRVLRFGTGTAGVTAARATYSAKLVSVQPGTRIRLIFWSRITQSPPGTTTLRGNIRWFSGTTYDSEVVAISRPTSNHGWQRNVSDWIEVPAGIDGVMLNLRIQAAQAPMYAYLDDVSIEVLSTEEEAARARHTVALDVNGNISGTVNENDGQRSVFSILATIFRVISSGSVGMEWQNGYLRAYSGAIQLIMGINFGAASNLCFWYGPNVGAANCTKSNGTIWFDNSGAAYFGGTLSAGILKNAVRSTQISGTAQVETGPFGTNGGQKVVTYSLSFSNNGLVTTNPGGATLSGTVVLERSYNGGPWTQVSSTAITGERVSNGEGAGQWMVRVNAGGSSTYTDNMSGTGNFNYRARITAASGWPYTVGSNPGEQTLTVTSVEQP